MFKNFNLPVPIEYECEDDCSIEDEYMKSRDAIKTAEELELHIAKWKDLWSITTESVLLATHDANETFKCFEKLRNKEGCEHIESEDSLGCFAISIMAPVILIRSHMIAKKFTVPFNVAFIQFLRACNLEMESEEDGMPIGE